MMSVSVAVVNDVSCDADAVLGDRSLGGGEVRSLYPCAGDLSELQLFMTMS